MILGILIERNTEVSNSNGVNSNARFVVPKKK